MRNLTLMTDLYQLTMMNGYYRTGMHERKAVFDLFFRHKGMLNYAVSAGLQQAIEYIQDLHFSEEDIAYLRSTKLFDAAFLDYLRGFRFTGDLYSVVEGEVVFPYEPILIVHAPIIEAQLIETALLTIIGHQTLIATKASRVAFAAGERGAVEFGLRRAQGPDAGIFGARASVIGGVGGTSNVLAGKLFGLSVKGTQSHSWIMAHASELEAFEAFARIYPDNCLLLVDTYDTLRSGMPNAIKVFHGLKAKGHKPLGIRIDSGDMAYLSKRAREMLDEAGFNDAIIFVSGDLDEHLITSLTVQDAKIDVFGVGTKLITCEESPSLGGVYKLAQIEQEDGTVPCMKISDSIEKMTNPGFKALYRLYEKGTGMAVADVIALRGETLPKPIVLVHETETWKRYALEDYELRNLHTKIFADGKCVYRCPNIPEIVEYRKKELNRFWEEYKRLTKPHIYKVNLSEQLLELKQKLIKGRCEHEI